MTAPTRHPAWCSPGLCTVDLEPEVLEELHRSVPVIFDDGQNEATVFVYAEQAPLERYPTFGPDVVVLILPAPVRGPFYVAEPVLDRIAVEVSVAEQLGQALTAIVAEARR